MVHSYKKVTMNVDNFLKQTTVCAQNNGIRVIFSENDNVVYPYDGSFVSGYFDQDKKILAVAQGRNDWLDVFVHESCHMDQFLENSPVWVDGVNSVDRYFDWLGDKDIADHVTHTTRAGLIEFDCEKRPVEKIKKYQLPIDIPTYTKKANAYSQFYLHSLKTRKWYPANNKPYDNEIILNACSTEFPDTYSLDSELEKAFDLVYCNIDK